MKKNQLLYVGLISLGLLSGCSGGKSDEEQAVKEFSTNFAAKVQANQLDSLRAVYPLLENVDSVYMSFNADSLKIEQAGEGLYKVRFNSASSMLVKYAEDGKISVKETTGVVAWPAESVAFAKGIGGVKGEMTDSAAMIVMDNLDGVRASLADEYINSRKNAINVGSIKITKQPMYGMDEGRGYVTLTNTTDQPIKGSEYSIIERHYYCHMGVEESYNRSEKGRDIPAKGSIKHNFSYSGHGFLQNVKVSMKTPSAEEFMANYTPKGDEWANYAKAHPEALRLKTDKLANGPYEITGKIGGKYAVTMHLNEGMKDGSYYYNKNGAKKPLTLKVKSFNPRTGAIVIEETAPDGKMSGTFTGTLSKDAFKGKMDVYNGNSFDFDLAVK